MFSVPVPKNSGEIDDQFATIILAAPDFAGLNRLVSYSIDLEMMVGSLKKGIEQAIERTRSEVAISVYQQSIAELNEAFALYKSDQISEASKKMAVA